MRTVYRVRCDHEYQVLEPVERDAVVELMATKWRFDGSPIAPSWVPPEAYVLYPNYKKPDIWSLFGGDNFAFEPHACRILASFLDDAGEQLPLPYEGRVLTVLNITRVVNCLDMKKSKYDPDSPHVIDEYAFHANRLGGHYLFKIPEQPLTHVFTVEGVAAPCDEFKPLVEKHGLKGLRFKKIWSSEDK